VSINSSLQKEFAQVRYVRFEVVDILPDDKLRGKVHTVDVLLRYAYVRRDAPAAPNPPVVTNNFTFAIQKLDDGTFAVGESAFFSTLGLRQGLGIVQGLLAVMALCALLSFWVWMGLEAYRARPRSLLWRVIVLLPFLGACGFFVCVYLPGYFRGARLRGEGR
jgi:hypothetical protein